MCHKDGDSEDISYGKIFPPPPPPRPPSLMSMGAPAPSLLLRELLSPCVSPLTGHEETSRGEKDPAPILTAPTRRQTTPPHHTQQEDVLAGNPLVEVDVAQVLGGLLRSTDFLVIVDHPPATGRRGAQGHEPAANAQLDSPPLLSSLTPR